MDDLFIGCDLSLSNSGFVCINSKNEVLLSHNVKTTFNGSLMYNRMKRLQDIRAGVIQFITAACEKGSIKGIAIENYSYGSKGKIVQIVEGGTIARYEIMKYASKNGTNIKENIIEVAPISLKKFIVGKISKDTNAKNIICREVYKRWGFESNDDNTIDAFSLAHLAKVYIYEKLGKKQNVPNFQIEVVKNILNKMMIKNSKEDNHAVVK